MTITPTRPLADSVTDLMNRITADTDTCGWLVATDHRDGSAVVVYRTDPGWPQTGVRGTTLYHWLLALRDAGYTAEARTDMEVFGRPEETSDIAWWLHITARTAPAATTA